MQWRRMSPPFVSVAVVVVAAVGVVVAFGVVLVLLRRRLTMPQ